MILTESRVGLEWIQCLAVSFCLDNEEIRPFMGKLQEIKENYIRKLNSKNRLFAIM